MPSSADRLVQPDDLLRLVAVADPQLSPDGHQVAFVRKGHDAKRARTSALWVAPSLGAMRARALTEGPRDSSPRWSPDGASILFVRAAVASAPQLMLLSLGREHSDAGGGAKAGALRGRRSKSPAVRALTRFPEGSISAPSWSPDGTRVAFKWRRTMKEFTDAAEKARKASGASAPPLVIDDPWYRLDGDGYFGSSRYRLLVLDLDPKATGHRSARGQPRAERRAADRELAGFALHGARLTEVLAIDHLDDFTFDWSPDGGTIAVACNRDPRALFHPERAEIVLVDPEGRTPPRSVAGLPDGPKESPQWSPDGTRLAWAGRRGRSSMYDTANVELWCAEVDARASRARGKRVRSLTAAHDVCLMVGTLSDTADATFAPWIRWAPDGRSIFMRIGWHGAGRIASIAAGGGEVKLHTDGSADLMPGSISIDGHRIACIRSAPTEPPEIAVAEVLGRQFDVVPRTRFNASYIGGRRLAKPTEHWVLPGGGERAHDAARRGAGARGSSTVVHTWVMRPPPGAPRRHGAAVLEVHGGPHAQYGVAYFHEFQVLAAAGYTVVFSNPRGSKGYGARFCGAIRGRWGTADWDDVKSVTRFMSRLPGVRRNRLAIMGGSYGGYMTNWAISHSRDYRAAITDRCVSDLVSMCGSSDFPEVPGLYWPGVSWDRPQSLWRSSPIAHFKGVTTPTLIIHSEGDLRCNIEQAEQVHAALVAQGVPCRFVRYPKQTSHGMSRVGPADLRIHRLGQILDWWATRLA